MKNLTRIPLLEHYADDDCCSNIPLGVEVTEGESVDANFAEMSDRLEGMADSAKSQIKTLQEKLQVIAKIAVQLPTIQEKFENFQNKFPEYDFIYEGMDLWNDMSLHVYTRLSPKDINEKIEPSMESNIQDFFGGTKLHIDKSSDNQKWWVDVQYNYGKEA